ncbi:putative FAD-linked oxidoreductase [Eubacterium plexicaudatum ASF492]|nr:putative FAD-linked oxidoreductase [Eubacterium plexicaudatum ASF492]
MYNQLTQEIMEQIKAVSEAVFSGEDINPDYEKDEMPIYGTHMPDLAVQPRSTQEVAAIMKICYDNNIPVTPRGAGTGLAGGAVPLYGGVLLDLTKMNKIKSYDMENFVVEIEAGVLLNDLAEDCQTRGMLYPPDPGEKFACVGGNVATNAGGMRAVKYGATRDYVRAMTVVLPTGEITKLGATVSKTSSGYSLLNLMIGSEGTLGIITELTLKIIPAPKAAASLIIPFEDLHTALATVPQFKMAHMEPQAIEFMEREIVLASERYIGKSVFPQELEGIQIGAYLLVTLDGNSEDEVDALVEQAAELAVEAGAIDVLVADTPSK